MLPRRNLAHITPVLSRPRFRPVALVMVALFAVSLSMAASLQPLLAQDNPAATATPIPTKTQPRSTASADTPRITGTPVVEVAEELPEETPVAAVPETSADTPTGAPKTTPIPDSEIPASTATNILTDTTLLPGESATSEAPATNTRLPDTAPPDTALSNTAPPIDYTPTFTEMDCPFVTPWSQTIICGTLSVPEVRANPESARIDIFVMIIKSQTTPLTDPILVLPGGPGGANSQSRNLYYGMPSHRNRDLVLLDPRGTGYSYPSLDCFETNSVGMTFASSLDATRACYERLLAEGRDLAGYVSSEQVEDVADLAKVLGYGKINLYATSYGTRVAVLLADRYPALVRSMVLDGVLPVAVNSLLEEPLNEYGAIQRIAQDCVAEPLCNGSFPALEARLLEVIDRYNRAPLPDDIGYGTGDATLKFIFKQMHAGGAKIPAFITALYYEDFTQACDLMPPAVGCFFAQNGATDRARLTPTVPTQSEAMLGIDFAEHEVAARHLYTWTRLMRLPVSLTTPLNTGTTAPPAIETPLDTEIAEAAPAVDPNAPPWRAHFTRPEDPLGPDLDRISWLMHDRDFARPEDLFAWLDTLSEQEVQEMLQTIPDTTFDSFSEGAYASVICSEEAPFYTLEDIALLSSRIPQQFGSLPARRAQEVKEICAFWEVPPVSAARKMTLPSSVPELITNGTHDSVTPAVWAERAAIYLDKAWLRLFPGYGHAILSTGDLCMQEMMENFYVNPLQDPTPLCFRNLRIEFEVP